MGEKKTKLMLYSTLVEVDKKYTGTIDIMNHYFTIYFKLTLLYISMIMMIIIIDTKLYYVVMLQY